MGTWNGNCSSRPPLVPGSRRECGLNAFAPPAIGSQGTIYLTSGCGDYFAVNPDGDLAWRVVTFDPNVSGAAIGSDGTVYWGDGNGAVVALNPDGTFKWDCDFPTCGEPGLSSPSIGPDGTVYIGIRISNSGQPHGMLLAID